MGSRVVLLSGLALGVALLAGCSHMNRGNVKTAEDAAFMRAAAEGNAAEVEMGRVALQRAASAEVKQFGQRMIDDHNAANIQLLKLANEKNIDLPTQPNLSQRMMADKLSDKTGPDFDKAYIKLMSEDHLADVEAYEKQSADGQDREVVSYARNTLPILRGHLVLAKHVAAQVGVDKD